MKSAIALSFSLLALFFAAQMAQADGDLSSWTSRASSQSLVFDLEQASVTAYAP